MGLYQTPVDAPLGYAGRSGVLPRERQIDNLESGWGSFARRHIGPNEVETEEMLGTVGYQNLAALIDATIPKNIRPDQPLNLPEAKSESEALAEIVTFR